MENKVAVITGGANGIGYSIANKFLENDAKCVIILDINEVKGLEAVKNLNEVYGESKAKFFRCDITEDIEIADEIIKQFVTVDVLVNSAGIGVATVKKIIDTNVTATIEWTYKFYEHMRTDKGGKGGTIINLASIFGFRINRYLPTYQASKFAVMGFTRSLGHTKNFECTGVRVMAICPGNTITNMTEDFKRDMKEKKMSKDIIDSLASKRGAVPQQPEVVGDTAVEIYKKADSGTAWLVEDCKPIEEIPHNDFFI